MGAAQTSSWAKEVAGGDSGGGAIKTACWGKKSANKGAACSTNRFDTMTYAPVGCDQVCGWAEVMIDHERSR